MEKTQTAVFGGGCFWCTEAIFKELRGVYKVESGYAGGTTINPTYYDITEGITGHAEVIRVEFDPTIISYEDLVDIFFHTHNPTTLNKQDYDVGTEYRSIILYTSSEQKNIAENMKRKLQNSGEYTDTIVTEIKPLETFYPAEAYHKDYYQKNSDAPYCQIIISPKLAHLRQKYSHKLT